MIDESEKIVEIGAKLFFRFENYRTCIYLCNLININKICIKVIKNNRRASSEKK